MIETVLIENRKILHHPLGLLAQDSPNDYIQTEFNDNNDFEFVQVKTVDGKLFFAGFSQHLLNSQVNSLKTSTVKYYGLDDDGKAIYEVTNDSYFFFDGEKITGSKREQFNSKTIYLGFDFTFFNRNNFIPEFWFFFNEDPTSTWQAPLVPKVTKNNEEFFLLMQSGGQKLYMDSSNQMLIETKGLAINLSDTLVSTGTYNWETKQAPTIEENIEDLPEANKIILKTKNGSMITIDSSGDNDIVEISLNDNSTSLRMTANGDIEIKSNGNIVFNEGEKSVAANGDTVSINYGTINITSGSVILTSKSPILTPAGPAPITSIPFSFIAFKSDDNLTNISDGTLSSPNRKERVE